MFPFYVQHFYRKNTTQAECHILADPYIFLTELQLVQKKKVFVSIYHKGEKRALIGWFGSD